MQSFKFVLGFSLLIWAAVAQAASPIVAVGDIRIDLNDRRVFKYDFPKLIVGLNFPQPFIDKAYKAEYQASYSEALDGLAYNNPLVQIPLDGLMNWVSGLPNDNRQFIADQCLQATVAIADPSSRSWSIISCVGHTLYRLQTQMGIQAKQSHNSNFQLWVANEMTDCRGLSLAFKGIIEILKPQLGPVFVQTKSVQMQKDGGRYDHAISALFVHSTQGGLPFAFAIDVGWYPFILAPLNPRAQEFYGDRAHLDLSKPEMRNPPELWQGSGAPPLFLRPAPK